MKKILAFVGIVTAWSIVQSSASELTDQQSLARDMYEEMVSFRTVKGQNQTNAAQQALLERLHGAGFSADDAKVLRYDDQHGVLYARYKGDGSSGKKPILMIAHIDVVDALKEDWTQNLDPFALTEKDGYYYGRGSDDDKLGVASLVATFIRLKSEGFMPNRDLIFAVTSDEETGQETIKWLIKNHRDMIDADFVLNADAGGGKLRDGKAVAFAIQASEKVYLTFHLEVRNKGGHSSRPPRDNAIYQLSNALVRLENYTFPAVLNEVTQGYFREVAKISTGPEVADMKSVGSGKLDRQVVARLAESTHFNALLRTTCVATRLFAGHADNALPQLARATVNCRILPGLSPDDVEAKLVDIIADPEIKLSRDKEPTASPPSPLRDDVLGTVTSAVPARYPGIVLIPDMSTGATDGLYTRNAGLPTYGIAQAFHEPNDSRIHGQDERIRVEDFYGSLDFWHDVLIDLSD